MTGDRDHIFISYATEQSALCDWIARRLAACGYAVWCDRQKLLGGENWPNDIDTAIEKRTFRMLALLSKESVRKNNPQGEWLKGRAIGQRHKIDDFVIPLNTDGLTPAELPWNLHPINYLDFTDWASGFDALRTKLERIDTPKTLNDGRRLAIESIAVDNVIRCEPEVLLSNCFEITQLPPYILKYSETEHISQDRCRALLRRWACRVETHFIYAFSEPPETVPGRQKIRHQGRVPWKYIASVDGLDTRDLVAELLRKCIIQLLVSKGMSRCKYTKNWYLPNGKIDKNRIPYTVPGGKTSWFGAVGTRRFKTIAGTEEYRYHVSPSFDILSDESSYPTMFVLRPRIHLTDSRGQPLAGSKRNSRRKHLCKHWFNKEWCVRILGLAQLLADSDKIIRHGPTGQQQLCINATPISPIAPLSIMDEHVAGIDEAYTMSQDRGEMNADTEE